VTAKTAQICRCDGVTANFASILKNLMESTSALFRRCIGGGGHRLTRQPVQSVDEAPLPAESRFYMVPLPFAPDSSIRRGTRATPMTTQKRVLITSALPYINGIKHLGNLAGSMLPADVYARFQRSRGRETLYICATDEHGTPAELAAIEENLPIAEYCTKWWAIQKELGEGFGLSFDYFGRSSSVQNRELTQHFAKVLWERGHIEERTTRQVYSKADGRFLPDRYVIGTCPHCGYDRARGDQCENCTRVLDPADLIQPRSALSGSTDIELRDSKHLFLLQAKFSDELRKWIGERHEWSPLVSSIALKWLDEGLQDRGITRDLQWGVPVNAETWGPNPDGKRPDVEGLKGKVFYVWFDAPIEYIGSTKEWADAAPGNNARDWKSWWVGDDAQKNVRYVEFMGKDNDHLGFGREVEARRSNQRLQLAQLLRRQVLDEPKARHLHGRGARDPAARFLALVPDRERARERGLVVHVAALRRHREQRPR
jgi:hypothetical protein